MSKDADREVLHVGRPLGSQLEELDIAAFHAVDEDCGRGPPDHLPAWQGNHLRRWAAARKQGNPKAGETLLNGPFLPPALPGFSVMVSPPPKGTRGKGNLSHTSAGHGSFMPCPPRGLKIAALPEVALGRPPKKPKSSLCKTLV